MKIQQRQYKALKEQILQDTPKSEQKAVIKKLKEEQMRKMNKLGTEYEGSISEMMQQQSVSSYKPYVLRVYSVGFFDFKIYLGKGIEFSNVWNTAYRLCRNVLIYVIFERALQENLTFSWM